MSVVNQMLKDLDERSAFDEGDDAEYQEAPENKRVRYMIMFIILVILTAAGYFTYRAMGAQYFLDLYAEGMTLVGLAEEPKEQTKQVKVNKALDQIMPTRSGSAASTPEAMQPEETDEVAEQQAQEALDAPKTQEQSIEAAAAVADFSEESEFQPLEEPGELAEEVANQDNEQPPQELIPVPVPGNTESDMVLEFGDGTAVSEQIAELKSRAAQAMAENDVAMTTRIYRQILNIDFRQHDTRKKLAVLYYSNGDTENASVILSDGIDINPERVDFRLMLARLFYRDNRNQEAYRVLAGVEPDVQRNVDFYGLKATVAQELSRDAEASHLYGRLVIFEPNRAQWWLGLAISLDRMGQSDGALRAYENAADLRQLSVSADDFIRQRIQELGG